MLKFSDYIADWPDMPYSNFAQRLEGQVSKWEKKNAILYRASYIRATRTNRAST